jgi:hypothetical protein
MLGLGSSSSSLSSSSSSSSLAFESTQAPWSNPDVVTSAAVVVPEVTEPQTIPEMAELEAMRPSVVKHETTENEMQRGAVTTAGKLVSVFYTGKI